MKRRSIPVFSVLLLSFTILFVACSKEGPAGAKGDTGAQGAAGPAGPAGTPGPKGDTGTANVIYSAWTDVKYNPEIDPNNGDTLDFLGTINAPKLTNAILNSGEMKVYCNLGSATTPTVIAIPYAFEGILISPAFQLQKVLLVSNAPNEVVGTYTTGTTKFQQYRYILIPGSVQGRYSHVNWKDYEEVKRRFNIKD
jgi:hypothetical protein